MENLRILAALLSLSLFWGCDEAIVDNGNNRISEAEQQLLEACSTSPLEDSLAIAQNLIGNWELVGYACGGCAPNSAINASITFTDTSGIASYQDNTFGETIGFKWDVQVAVNGEDTSYFLATDPIRAYLYMTSFCEDYMFRNGVVNDGGMFIYQKE